MKRILITGFTGFVSDYLLDALNATGEQYEVIGLSRSYNFNYKLLSNLNVRLVKLDLNDKKHLQEVLYLTRPDYIYHLASDSSVSYSWRNPIESFQNNTNIFLNLIESVKDLKLACRVLSIGSSEEYGIVDLKNIPLIESSPLNPVSPYAVARVAQELLSKVYANGYGVDIVMTRSFNHIGPGQKDNFVISSFAKQIIQYKLNIISRLEVGNISVVRDFLDVRDVVNAYISLMNKGVNGQVYNICSNVGYSLSDIIYKMMDIESIKCDVETNNLLIRPSDNPIIIGNNSKIRLECDWQPVIPIEQSLKDILSYWTSELSS